MNLNILYYFSLFVLSSAFILLFYFLIRYTKKVIALLKKIDETILAAGLKLSGNLEQFLNLLGKLEPNKIQMPSVQDTKSNESLPAEQKEIPVQDQKFDEIGLITKNYNLVRSKELDEKIFNGFRVQLQPNWGRNVEDLSKEPVFSRHPSGSCVVKITSNKKILLFPYFNITYLGAELQDIFDGGIEFNSVRFPAICEQIEEYYKISGKGTVVKI